MNRKTKSAFKLDCVVSVDTLNLFKGGGWLKNPSTWPRCNKAQQKPASTQQELNTPVIHGTTSVCFGTCSEAEEWHRFQPQAKYKLLLHGVYLVFCLLKKQFWWKLTKAWEKLPSVPWRIRALSEVSKVSGGHLGITGQFTVYPLIPFSTYPRSAFTYMTSLPPGAPFRAASSTLWRQGSHYSS